VAHIFAQATGGTHQEVAPVISRPDPQDPLEEVMAGIIIVISGGVIVVEVEVEVVEVGSRDMVVVMVASIMDSIYSFDWSCRKSLHATLLIQ